MRGGFLHSLRIKIGVADKRSVREAALYDKDPVRNATCQYYCGYWEGRRATLEEWLESEKRQVERGAEND